MSDAANPLSSQALERSPLWYSYGVGISREFRKGVPFEDIFEMNIAIKQRTLEPYRKHRAALDRLVWHDDPQPKRIVELGPGYGGMASFWPPGSRVFNVDLPEMLEVQASYLAGLAGAERIAETLFTLPGDVEVGLIPFTEVDAIDFHGAYFFSTFALTETTLPTWDYYIRRAPDLAGIYAVGWRGWVDIPGQLWPWERLRDCFKDVRSNLTPYTDYDGAATDSLELAAVNR